VQSGTTKKAVMEKRLFVV